MNDPIEEAIEAAEMRELNQAEPELPRLVVVQLTDDGNFQVTCQGVSNLEAPTLLKLAAKNVEERLGL
jgi:hypothetical protein